MPNNEYTFAQGRDFSNLAPPAVTADLAVVPTTGTTYQLMGRRRFFFLATATLAAFTLKLPAQPVEGDVAWWGFGAFGATALTVTDANGNAVAGAPTAGAAFTSYEFQYVSGAWRRWR